MYYYNRRSYIKIHFWHHQQQQKNKQQKSGATHIRVH